MNITKIAVSLFVLGVCAPLFVSAAPALDSIPDAVKSKYYFDGPINAVVSDGTTLYIGGSFTGVTLKGIIEPPTDIRNNIAAISLSDYILTDFDPNLDGEVKDLALSSDGSILYAGGNFSCVGTYDIDLGCLGDARNYLAAIDTRDGTALPTVFSPEPDWTVNALELNSDDSVLYAGGGFFVGDADYAAAYTTADNTATAFDPGFDNEVTDIVLSSDDTTLYALGYFESVNDAIPQQYIAALDAMSGATTDFNAALDGGGVNELGNGLALSSDDATLYVGGDFSTAFFHSTGEGMVFNETTEEPVATFPKISTGGGGGGGFTVYAAVPDGDGGWYVGGSFTHVNGVARKGLAHINADGTLDAGWDAGIDVNVGVYTLELSPDGTILYAGGNFIDENEQYLAAYSATDGTITAFHPFPVAPVYDIEISADGETIYFGGEFGSVTESYTARYYVAAFDTTGAGTLLPFVPNACDQVKALQLTNDGSTLYMGGDFTCVNSQTTLDVRNRIAAFSTAGAGTLVAGFNPNANSTVEDLLLAPDETTIYTGGAFTIIGGASRNQFAEITLADGTATALDAGIMGTPETVYTVALSSDESTIYIGGDSELTTIGGQPRRYFGEISATTGAVTDFYPAFNGDVQVVAASGGEVFIGGSFTGTNATNVSNLIAVNTSDSSLITAFAPAVNNMVRTLSLSSDDTLLYVGGDLTDVNSGTARDYLAALGTTDGTATAFDPVGTLHIYGSLLKADDSELYVGSYDVVDDTAVSELLIFDAAGVAPDETPPVITLLGSTPVNLTVGDVYVDAGATALDDVDGDITADIVTVNPVDTNTVGVYTVTYNVSDAALNPAIEVTRTVNVIVDLNVDEDDDDGGGGSGSRVTLNRSTSGYNLEYLLAKLLGLLQQYLALLIEEQQQ